MLIFRFIALLLVFRSGFSEVSNQINITPDHEVINLAVVACGDRVKETLVVLKSALMFTKSFLNFIIVTEPTLKRDFLKQVYFCN